MSTPTTLLPFQPASMSTAQLAVSFLARYSGRTHHLYTFRLRERFAWCERNGLDPLVGVQRARRAVHPRAGRARPDGLERGVDDVQRPRLLQRAGARRPLSRLAHSMSPAGSRPCASPGCTA